MRGMLYKTIVLGCGNLPSRFNQRETWEGPRRCFRWNAFPRPYSSAN